MQEMIVFQNIGAPGLRELKWFDNRSGLGYFYIIEFDNGRVKVGSTKHPFARAQSISYSARIYAGGGALRIAMSAPHEGYQESEKRMHQMLDAARIPHTELFKVTFEEALNIGNQYSFSCSEKKPAKLGERTTEDRNGPLYKKQLEDAEALCKSFSKIPKKRRDHAAALMSAFLGCFEAGKAAVRERA